MESLISNLRHHHATSASVAVSQAMLLQALNRTRQVASIISSNQSTQNAGTSTHRNRNHNHHHHHNNHNLLNQGQQNASGGGQFAPLDLSVKNVPGAGLGLAQRQVTSLDLLNGTASRAKASNGSQRRNDRRIHRREQLIVQFKQITSSTSPTSSGSASSNATTCSTAHDANNNRLEDKVAATAAAAAQDVISSTNGRRHQRPAGKKQKGAKSHLCNFCGRSFSRSDMLTRHSRLHSGLKPYQCGKCFQVFSRSDHLSTHERTHTGEKPYQCNFCDYSACRRDMITRHMRIHNGTSQSAEIKPRSTARRKKRAKLSDFSERIVGKLEAEFDDLDGASTSSVSSLTES